MLRLKAGPISVVYSSGSLRYLRCGGAEVLRQIYVALRDAHWGTVPGRISREKIDRGADWFHIEISVEHRQDDIDFAWDGSLEGHPDGSIRFTLSGAAASSFWANRIGFCVLHPIAGVAGRECGIEHTSGTREMGRFPGPVSPHQPFFDVRAISHEVLPGLRAHVRMEGDTFETEDHRNWTDDSFKTYSRPLALPYPYKINDGDRIGQSVSVTFEGPLPVGAPGDRLVNLTVRNELQAPFPDVNFSRVDLHLDSPVWLAEFGKPLASRPVEIAIFTRDSAMEIPRFVDALEKVRPQVSRWLIFDVVSALTPAAVRDFRAALAGLYPGVPVGGGSNANFAELNRNRHVVEGLDFVSWPINPQVHAADEHTLVENLQGQRATVETARSFCAGRPLVISAVTIPHPGSVAAAWLVASIKHLAEAGIHSVTYRDIPGAESVSALIDEFHPSHVIATSSSDPLAADGLSLRDGSRSRLLLANFLGHPQDILVDGAHRTTLGPYAVAAIDGVNGA